MDDEENVVGIQPPDSTNTRTQRPVAHNGGAVRVRLDAEGSKSTSSPVRAGKFMKQLRAHVEYKRPRKQKVVRHYLTGWRAQLDAEDIDFDIYEQARESIEVSSMKMLPEQNVQAHAPKATQTAGQL